MPAEGVPLLQMRGITKSFFGVPVLDAVDLDVMAGEVHAVVGANGANDADPMPLNQYVETASSSSWPVTAKTTRSQILVTRSAMRSRLWAAQSKCVA